MSSSPLTYMPITALAGYGARGVKVTTIPFTEKVPARYSVLVQSVPSKQTSTSTVWLFTEAGLIRLLMVNVTGLVTETPVALFAGVVAESLKVCGPEDVVPA